MRPPCDEAILRSGAAAVPCRSQSRGWILAATILGSSLAFIDGTVVNVALPAIQSTFHANVADVQWVVESYGLFLAALILVGGSLGDLFGRRVVFLSGVAIFALSSAACGLAANITQLIAARSMQGIGAALLVPGSLAIISASFDEKSRGQAIGTWSGSTAITTAAGPVLGGWLVEHASWRWAFFINLPIAAAVIVISLWHIPESRRRTAGKVDWLGAALVTIGLGGLVYGFVESSNLGWKSPFVAGSLLLGVAALGLFVIVERKEASPMLPLGLFASRNFTGANLLTLFLYAGIGVFFFLFPLNLIQVQGYSATMAGAAMLPMILLVFLLSRWSGGLVTRYGPRRPLIVGPLIVALGFMLFALPGANGLYWKSFFPPIIVLGLGLAVTVAPLTTVVMNSVDRDHVGTASGINNAVSRVAGVLAIAVFGVVMLNAFSSRLKSDLNRLRFPAEALHDIDANANKLAGLPVPAGLDASDARAVRESVRSAFIYGFRVVALICAGLSVASAAVTAKMITNRTE
jgi:EmrB/QacA subfamily drug resistance transporter